MADKSHYNRKVSVSQSVIDEIKKLGMSKAIKKAVDGDASAEFIEGVRRFYPQVGKSIDAKKKTKKDEGTRVASKGPSTRADVEARASARDRKKKESEEASRAVRSALSKSNKPKEKEDNPAEKVVKNIHKWGEKNVADPARKAVKSIHKWGEENIAEPNRRGRGDKDALERQRRAVMRRLAQSNRK